MGQVLDCKVVAQTIKENLKAECARLSEKGIIPTIAILRVGNREDDIAYERGILSNCKSIGAKGVVYEFPQDVKKEQFINALESINKTTEIHGILIFRPLPEQVSEEDIKHIISPDKDIDCMNPKNLAKVFEGDLSGFSPCTAAAVMEIIEYYKIDLTGKMAAVLGRSMVVGKPLSMMLLSKNATVTICHSRTKNMSDITGKCDVLVAAIGKATMIGKEYIKPGAIVIDVGINVDDKGKLCGDVNFDECLEVAGQITPVPGGVGSVTTAVLMKNLVKAAAKNL